MDDARKLGERIVKACFESDRNADAAMTAAFARLNEGNKGNAGSDASVQTDLPTKPITMEVTP